MGDEWFGSEDLYPANEETSHDHFHGGEALYPRNDEYSADYISPGDFHMHSNHSDGVLKPTALMELAKSRGIEILSLTDHDTLSGVEEAQLAAERLNLTLIKGVEITAETSVDPNTHILGYFANYSDSSLLEATLVNIRQGRETRGKSMLAKLESIHDIKLSWDRVLEVAGEAAVGRPHIARVLLETGHVTSFQQAFTRYLKDGGSCYVKGYEFGPEEVVKLIHNSGGVSVLAHPWSLKKPEVMIQRLVLVGLDGLEVFRDREKTLYYSDIADDLGLLKLGGSDYHGIEGKHDRALGQLPMLRSHVDKFLKYSKEKWLKGLKKQVEIFAAKCHHSECESDTKQTPATPAGQSSEDKQGEMAKGLSIEKQLWLKGLNAAERRLVHG